MRCISNYLKIANLNQVKNSRGPIMQHKLQIRATLQNLRDYKNFPNLPSAIKNMFILAHA